MKGLVRAAGNNPRLILAVMLVVTLSALAGVSRLAFDSSLDSLTVPGDPARAFNEKVREIFGDEEIGVVALVTEDVYTPESVAALRGLTADLGTIEGVSRTLSITNASDPTADVLAAPPLLEPGKVTKASAARLRMRVKANPIYIPNLVAEDGTATAVTVFFRDATSTEDEAAVDQRVLAVLAAYQGPGELYYTGMSHVRVQAIGLMRHDLLQFLPVSLAFMMVVLFGVFRSLRATVLPLGAVALGVGSLMGMMGWVGAPIALPTLVLPSLLLVIGGSYSVHVVTAFLEESREHASDSEGAVILAGTLSRVGLPVSVSAMTTAVGFGSLAIHPIPAIAGLGVWAVVGIAVIAIGCLFGVPLVMLSLPARRRDPAAVDAEGETEWFSRLDHAVQTAGAWSIDHRYVVFAIASFFLLVSLAGARNIRVDTDFLKAFRPGNTVRASHDAVSSHLVGPNPISVILTASEPNYFKSIESLRRVREFQEFAESLPGVETSISMIDYLEEIDLGLQAASEIGMTVDDEGNLIESEMAPSFWDAPAAQLPQVWSLVGASRNTFSGLVDEDFRRLNITLRSSLSGSAETAELDRSLTAYAKTFLPVNVELRTTGALMLVSQASNRIISGQVESLGLAFGVIFVVLSLMFLSLRVGGAAMIPNVLPVFAFFGIMGWFGVELNLATSIIGAVALGISVDDTIHYMARLNNVVKTTSSQRDALLLTLHDVGRPVVATSMTLTAGFAVMTVSGFSVISDFGWLSAATMMIALMTNLLLLPALLATVPVVSVWDLVSARLGEAPHRTIPLFEGIGRLGVRLVVLLGRLEKFAEGELIVRKGEQGEEMYLVLAGTAEVQLDNGIRVPLERGGIFGEMAMLRSSPRGADVAAITDVEVLAIDEAFLRRLRVRYPRVASRFFLNIARILSDRLEGANVRAARAAALGRKGFAG
ncbi:MAG: putative RND superfamily exporter protein [Hyphomicrobiaceae bacterium]